MNEEEELCEHGIPTDERCEKCEYWERVDYEYDRSRDKRSVKGR